jgi:hypothetical protein
MSKKRDIYFAKISRCKERYSRLSNEKLKWICVSGIHYKEAAVAARQVLEERGEIDESDKHHPPGKACG